MPKLFGKKKKSKKNANILEEDSNSYGNNDAKSNFTKDNNKNIENSHHLPAVNHTSSHVKEVSPDVKYTFQCQLAHGSPTGIITAFSNVKELYCKLAECYDISSEDILFCTLNTHKVDSERLLGGQIGLEDFIFAHIKGQRKEVEMHKTEPSLGLTITDNGAGYPFVKRVKPGSLMDVQKLVSAGDHIESIDGEVFVGRRHYDVARKLHGIPVGALFTIKLVEPFKSALANLSSRSEYPLPTGLNLGASSGKKTIRLRSCSESVPQPDVVDPIANKAVNAINRLVESLLGVDDKDMAFSIWEVGKNLDNPHAFSIALDQEMGSFGFPDELIFDFWGAINDAKTGRLNDIGVYDIVVDDDDTYEQF